jgi:hypothetical protein
MNQRFLTKVPSKRTGGLQKRIIIRVPESHHHLIIIAFVKIAGFT